MKITTMASIAWFAFAAAAAQAQVNFTDSSKGFPKDPEVKFDHSGPFSEGNTIKGTLKPDGGHSKETVDFSSSSMLKVKGDDLTFGCDETFKDLMIKLDDPAKGFGSLSTELGPTASGMVTFTVDTNKGDFSHTFDMKKGKDDQNFFGFTADAGTIIDSISFTSTVGLNKGGDVRIGGVCNTPAPEPASLLGLGLGAVAVIRRRKAKKLA